MPIPLFEVRPDIWNVVRKNYSTLDYRSGKSGSFLTFPISALYYLACAAIDFGICPYCRDPLTTDNMSPDHVFPIHLGGSWDLDNLKYVCRCCNEEKSALPLPAYLETNPHRRKYHPHLNKWVRTYVTNPRCSILPAEFICMKKATGKFGKRLPKSKL